MAKGSRRMPHAQSAIDVGGIEWEQSVDLLTTAVVCLAFCVPAASPCHVKPLTS